MNHRHRHRSHHVTLLYTFSISTSHSSYLQTVYYITLSERCNTGKRDQFSVERLNRSRCSISKNFVNRSSERAVASRSDRRRSSAMISIISSARCYSLAVHQCGRRAHSFQGHRHLSVRPHAVWLATCPATFSVSPSWYYAPMHRAVPAELASLCIFQRAPSAILSLTSRVP